MSKPKITVSLLIPTLGTRIREITRLLDSLREQTFKDYEVVLISQDNYELLNSLLIKYPDIDIKNIFSTPKGLSISRNVGLDNISGNLIILSDDDCWYPPEAIKTIVDCFARTDADILLTQIFDKSNNQPYKNYSIKEKVIKNKLELMSKSSIEIAFKKKSIHSLFDTDFGLGSRFVCGEEVDFLINNLKSNRICYVPVTTVYHDKKNNKNNMQIKAKGALYAKNYNLLISVFVLCRDLLLKRENNFKNFMKGYYEFKTISKKSSNSNS